MIGDKNLDILEDTNSDVALRKLVWSAAASLGYQKYFTSMSEPMDDDHMPFVRLGVPSLDVIDFDYPPWHKDTDTLDKISRDEPGNRRQNDARIHPAPPAAMITAA